MNIFVSDENPEKAAKNLDDKRVIKMILESTQLLCTAVNIHNGSQCTPYKSTHVNHPSSIWARETRGNWIWLWNHAYALCDRYQAAYGKVHKCREVIINLVDDKMDEIIPDGPLTPFANCTSNKEKEISFKNISDPIEAYRRYLIARWNTDKLKPKWTKRARPMWDKINKQEDLKFLVKAANESALIAEQLLECIEALEFNKKQWELVNPRFKHLVVWQCTDELLIKIAGEK